MKTRLSTKSSKSTERTLDPGDDNLERALVNPSTAQSSTAKGKRPKQSSKAQTSETSGESTDTINPTTGLSSGSGNASSSSLPRVGGRGSKTSSTPMAKTTPKGAQESSKHDSEDESDPEGERPWERSIAVTYFATTGEDEHPQLRPNTFGPEEVLNNMSDYEALNEAIFLHILGAVNKLPMRQGRPLEEMLIVHRQKKSRIESEIFHSHEKNCKVAQAQAEDARDELRLIAYLADAYGQNPLTGTTVEAMAEILELFKDQYCFFRDKDGDCCANAFFIAEATSAARAVLALAEKALPLAKHKRAFWRAISDECAGVFREWSENFDVEESAEEKEIRLKEQEWEKKMQQMREMNTHMKSQEKYLIECAEKIAKNEVPQNLLRVHPDDQRIFDHNSQDYVKLKTLKEKASRSFQAKLFRDAKRQHNVEEQQKRFREMDEEERIEQAKRARARAEKPFVQSKLDDLIGSIRNNGKPSNEDKSKNDPISSIDGDEDSHEDYQDWLNASFVEDTGEHDKVTPAGPNVMIKMTDIPTQEEFIPGEQSYTKLVHYARDCENKGQKLRVENWPRKLINAINFQYRYTFETYKDADKKDSDWQKSTPTELRLILSRMLEVTTGNKTASTDLVDAFRTWLSGYKLTIDWESGKHPLQHPCWLQINDIRDRYETLRSRRSGEDLSETDNRHLVKILAKDIVHENATKEGRIQMKTAIDGALNNLSDFNEALTKISDIVMAQLRLLFDADGFRPETSKRKEIPSHSSHGSAGESAKKAKRNPQSFEKKGKPSPQAKGAKCKGCGWDLKQKGGTGPRRCPRNDFKGCKSDPRRNNTNLQWADSEIGQKWKPYTTKGLPKDTSITLDNVADKWETHPSKTAGEGISLNQYCANLMGISHALINFSIVNEQQEARNKEDVKEPPALSGRLLLDTGAIGNSVVSFAFYEKLIQSNQTHELFEAHSSLTSAFNDSAHITKMISFTVNIANLNSSVVVKVKALIADINVDLIIDRDTVKTNNLIVHFPDHFADGELLDYLKQAPHTPISPSELAAIDKEEADWQVVMAFFEQQKAHPTLEVEWTKQLRDVATASMPRQAFKRQQSTLRREQRRIQKQVKSRWNYLSHIASTHELVSNNNEKDIVNDEKEGEPIPSVSPYDTYLASLASNFSRKAAFEREGNLVDIPDNKLESIPAEIIHNLEDETEYVKVLIEGPPVLQARLRKLVQKHRLVFRSNVQETPANLNAFKLDIDEKQWYTRANRLPARNTDSERAKALNDMLEILIKNQVIEPCDDSHYSHAFLVPKPNGKWRLVLDFKNLNKATKNYYKWPLPNIKEMLNRIGDSRPKYFAVFDLTSGYYQAPIDEASRKYTAFTTRDGVYRWRRLPMGLTGAGSYFQHSLATQVLQGSLHHGVELYLDDCMVHASSLEEFLERLEEVFTRFRNSGITLNPSKCKLGLTQVEYVGHTIDENGLHFTRSKLDKVLNFPRPETKKQMKSFIGLANYFRDHIVNHSTRVQRLQDTVAGYDKRQASRKIKWDDDLIKAFEDIREAIDQCPKLWFLDDFSPIFLQTDASDYGIGAYLYQHVTQDDGTIVEHPVGFISKSIASKHLSWDTPMKEGYAIFYALKKWEYLLRDRQFTILTDHRNLTQLRNDNYQTNKMVKRWFMTFQEYDILEWQYREGINNEIPDTLSRLCPAEPEEEQIPSLLFQLTGEHIPEDKWKTIREFHNAIAGHGGVERTMQKLFDTGHTWEHMRTHVRQFVKFCPCCQKMDQMKKVIHAYPFTTSSYGLWDTVSVDYIESLIPDNDGNNMIIVIVDNFSRFTDLYPAKSTNAMGAAQALLAFSGRYATPSCFRTDRGKSFANEIVKGLTESLGVNHHFTPAYSKEQNAIVERQNKEVMRHLRNIVFDKRVLSNWSKYLPIVQRIINTSINSATGTSPAQIVFPSGLVLDRTLVSETNPIYMSSYISELQRAQARIIAMAEHNLKEKDRKHMESYSKERTEFPDGSYVLAEHRPNALRRGPKSKLLPFKRGPLLVKSHNEVGSYFLQDLVTQKISEYHVSLLSPFTYDPNTLTPLEVAVTDTIDEFIVQECLAVRGNLKGKRSALEFKVRWAGYGPEDDTWEPWEFVRDNEAVQLFIYQHPNKSIKKLLKNSYIPPSQREPEYSDDEYSKEAI